MSLLHVLAPWLKLLTRSHCSIIEHIKSHEGVEWMTLGEMAQEFCEGRMPGVEVEGGVDD